VLYRQFFSYLAVLLLSLQGLIAAPIATAQPPDGNTVSALWQQVQNDGYARVIVGMRLEIVAGPPATAGSPEGAQARRLGISRARDRLLQKLGTTAVKNIHAMTYLPFVSMNVNSAALKQLEKNPHVTSITSDILYRPTLLDSSPLIGADDAWISGYSGEGKIIAILDTGVDKNHSFLDDKVISEACYSTTSGTSSFAYCASGSTAPDSGSPCSSYDCDHGTHVAGIAAGNGNSAGVGFSGVARNANLVAIQVFSQFNSTAACGSIAPCSLAYLSDISAGLDRVYDLVANQGLNIVSVNLSLGGANYTNQAACDAAYPLMTSSIALLKAVDVAVVASSGNDGDISAINHPACITGAIAVGSTTKSDTVASYSNSSPQVSLLSPGSQIFSSIPNESYAYFSGTSMAAPQVAGAWAVVKDKFPSASVTDVEDALQTTGIPITDTRNGITKPRIQVDAALGLTIEPENLTLTLSVDNMAEIYVNGVLVGTTSDWKEAGVFTVPLQAGTNVVAIKGTDSGGAAGLLAELSWGTDMAVTDTFWKVSASAGVGWETVGFDDSAWSTATSYGVYGVLPWLQRVVGFPNSSPAQWIWTEDNFNDINAYLRYTITVGEAPLAVDTTVLPDATMSQYYSQTLLASGGEPPYNWSLINGSLLPAGLTLDASTGTIYGNPTNAKTVAFSVQVNDTVAGTATQDLSLSVLPTPATDLTMTLSTDNTSDVYINGLLVGTTSNWKEAGVFSVPLQAGTNVVAIKGTNSGGAAGLLAELSWGEGTAVTDTAWKVSASAGFGWETIGFDDSAWSIATSYGFYGASPWLQRVVGFPINSPAQWIWTEDNFSDSNAYVRYTITVAGDAPLVVDTTALPGAAVGQDYEQVLIASGGEPPYNWSLIDRTELPAGLLLDPSTGTISGIPLNVETADFTVQVEDAAAETATQDLSLGVLPTPVTDLMMTLSTDNASEVYVNGFLVGTTSDWKEAGVFTVPLQAGSNVVAIKGTNSSGAAGLLAELSWASDTAVTDTAWKVSASAGVGWETVGFDDSAWSIATSYGFYGASPWLQRVVGFPIDSPAQWIWTEDNFSDTNAYLRYNIIVSE